MKAKDLKNSILQQAVQGKLVPQDPNDEPASVLLDRIREERHKLIEEGKLKAPKGGESIIYRASDGSPYEKRVDAKGNESEPVCIEDEIPFEIPESWEWTRLGSLLQLVSDGTHKTPDYQDSGVLFLSVQNISSGTFDLSKVKYISKSEHEKLCERVRPQKGDILLCRIGTLGKPIIVDVDYEFSIFVSLGLLRPIFLFLNQWIVNCIDSPLGYDWIQKVKVGGGTHTFKINLNDIPTLLIPLPPLVEQERIVAKIDELMPLVDEYGKLEEEREQLDEELPDLLRKSVLQQAVQGKLVPQDPNDEPASVLLDHIREERHKMIAEGKLKAPKGGESVIYRTSDGEHYEKRVDAKGHKSEPVCVEDEIPFEIPDSWEWVRLSSLTKLIHYGFTQSASVQGNARLLRITDIKNNSVDWNNVPFANVKEIELEKYQLHNNEIVIARSGSVGRAYIVKDLNEVAVFASYLIRAILLNPKMAFYLSYYLDSPFYWEQIADITQGTSQKNVNGQNLGNLLIPLPPLSEQERIVAKIEELMPLITSQQ